MSSASALPESIERACAAMVQKPALEFSRTLRSEMDKDPDYLRNHEAEVLPQLQHHLREAGVNLEGTDDREAMHHVAREVVVRLRGIERGRE